MYPIGERFDDMDYEEREEYLAELEDLQEEYAEDRELEELYGF